MLSEQNLTLREILEMIRRMPYKIRDAHLKWRIRFAVAVIFLATQAAFHFVEIRLLVLVAWIEVAILLVYLSIRGLVFAVRYVRAMRMEIASKAFDEEVIVEN